MKYFQKHLNISLRFLSSSVFCVASCASIMIPNLKKSPDFEQDLFPFGSFKWQMSPLKIMFYADITSLNQLRVDQQGRAITVNE